MGLYAQVLYIQLLSLFQWCSVISCRYTVLLWQVVLYKWEMVSNRSAEKHKKDPFFPVFVSFHENTLCTNNAVICDCCCLHNQPWTAMSWHVQRQSSNLVGSAQGASEHWNWQLLASSFWLFACFCSFFLPCEQQFVLLQWIVFFIQTQEKTPVWDCLRFEMFHKKTSIWVSVDA